MNEYIVIFLFVAWYTLSLIISENMGKRKKMGVQWAFFFCMMLSPVAGYVIVQLSPNDLKSAK